MKSAATMADVAERAGVAASTVSHVARLVEHLGALGHSRSALVSGLRGIPTTEERVAGYELGLDRAGLRRNRELIVSGKSAAGPAERAVGELLGHKDAPTAIVSGNNYMTIGVLRALRGRGMRVPDDMAVVAYDDLEFADVFQPRLTVVAQPVAQIASKAVELLIRRMADKDGTREPQRVQLPGVFVHRESCGCVVKGTSPRSLTAPGAKGGARRGRGAGPLFEDAYGH